MPDLIDNDTLKQIIEAALMAADGPLTVNDLTKLFAHGELDSEEGRAQIRDALKSLEEEADGRGYELKRVASGYRYQVRQELAEWVSRLWEEKPPRYSRALLETLALIAYRQPVTRGDIEQVRGVSVSQNIMRTLQERGWIRVVGQREVPGKPSLYGTTREFLDYFDLKSLDQLPPLTEIRSLVEPLVIEEVAEEARQVAEHDHPELAAQPADAGPALDADVEVAEPASEQPAEQATAGSADAQAAAEAEPAESEHNADEMAARRHETQQDTESATDAGTQSEEGAAQSTGAPAGAAADTEPDESDESSSEQAPSSAEVVRLPQRR